MQTPSMRNRRMVTVAIAGLLALAATAAIALRGTEPRYNGKTLSQWLRQNKEPPKPLIVPADVQDAILHIGANAIPTALRWISYDESPGWMTFDHINMHGVDLGLLEKLSASQKAHAIFASCRAIDAQNIFVILGPVAQPAIPKLKHLALTTFNEPRIHGCLRAISCTGPKALPALLDIIKEGRGEARVYAIELTPKFGTNALVAVPILTDCLHDKNNSVVAAASEALDKIALTRRIAAAAALKGQGHAAALAVPQLQQAATNTNSDLRTVEAAKQALQLIAPEPLTNNPPQ